MERRVDDVRALLPAVGNVNYTCPTAMVLKTTPLHLAANSGNAEICKLLIGTGAKVNARTAIGETPLHYATKSIEVCLLLIKAGADIHATGRRRLTPLHYAALSGNSEVCRLLVAMGVGIDERCEAGSTPLHLSARHHEDETCRTLLFLGANPNAFNTKGHTALSYAKTVAVCAALVEGGADPSYIPRGAPPDYLTPLQLAIKDGRIDAVRFFFEKCAEDLTQRTLRGRTLLQLAAHQQACKELLLSLQTQRAVEEVVGVDGSVPSIPRKPATSLSPL